VTGPRRVLKRAKLWMLLVSVLGVGFTCSQALAEEPPPTDPPPTVTEPPPVTASGPVTTVSSPPTPAPVPAPDPRPVQRKRAPAKKPAPVQKPAPAPKQAPAQAPARVTAPPAKPAATKPKVEQPATPTPTPVPATTPPPVTRVPARPATTAAQLRADKLHRIPGLVQTDRKAARPAAAPLNAGKSPKSTSPLEGLARDVPSVPPVSKVERSAAPSGVEQAATKLRWLFAALLGTAAVFLTAVSSRRVLDYRTRARLAAGDGHVIARMVPPPVAPAVAKQRAPAKQKAPAKQRAASAKRNAPAKQTVLAKQKAPAKEAPTKQNGKRGADPEPVSRPAPREQAPAGACEIGWSRGYFKSDFYVAAPEAEGGVSEVARSPAFRWTAAGEPPQDEAITAAHAALVKKLVAMGWEEVGAGESWYARRYQRRETAVR
jgi:hypothetical protein